MAWGPVRRLRRQGSLASAATRFAACLAGGSIATSTAKIINGSRTTLAHTTGRLQGSSGSGGCEYSGTAWGGASGGGHAKPPGSDDPAGHPPSRAQLVRDFIHDSLYHPLEGYFTRRSASGAGVVGSLQRPLDFTALEGQAQYLQAVREVYRQLQAAWLTPVEILQPHYGRAMVSCILQRWHQQAADAAAAGDSEPPLTIYEMGGGTGTLALNILDWLRAEHPAAYRRTRYRCVEISPVLAAIQRCRLAQGGHAERFAVRQHDAADLAAWRKADGAAGSSSGDGGSSSCGGGGDGGSGSGSGSGSSGSSSSGRASSCSNLSNGSNSSRLSDSGSSGGSSSCGGGGISGSGSGSGGGNAASSSNLSVSSNSSRLSDSGISSGGGGGGDEGVAGEHCFVVMCEVLDNLPHDRVQRSSGSGEWQQTLVAQRDPAREATGWTERRRGQDGPTLFEVLQPASDPLILRCLQAVQAAEGSSNGGGSGAGLAASAARMWRRLVGEAAEDVRWLPTGCLQLLDTLQQARPSHTLLAADFDQLPEVAVAGVNAPLVASTHGGRTHDHGSYLVPRGSADIFFPTDFALLCTLYRQAAAAAAARRTSSGNGSGSGHLAVSAEHMPTPDFMRRHSPNLSATRTRSGYNPLLQDYSNTAVFVGSCQWVRACGGGGGSSGGGGGLL